MKFNPQLLLKHALESIESLGSIGANVIYPYPTQADPLKKTADAHRRTLLTPRIKQILGLLTKFS